MNLLNKTLLNVIKFLSKNKISYMVIGGLANVIWGNPRATIDIDITIWVEDNKIESVVKLFTTKYEPLVDAPIDFIQKTRVLPLKTKNEVRLDIIFGALPFELDAINRAIEIEINNSLIKFCSPEDLILLKIVSKRDKDLQDIKGIAQARIKELDLTYLEPKIQELAALLERPEITSFWKKCKKL